VLQPHPPPTPRSPSFLSKNKEIKRGEEGGKEERKKKVKKKKKT
jgi:hypothetical protein